MKNLLILCFAASILLCVSSSRALAHDDYELFYTTAAKFDDTPQSVFSWDQKPWVYIKFLEDGDLNHGVKEKSKTSLEFTWDSNDPGTDPDKDFYKFFNAKKNEVWISFSDHKWDNIKEVGDWNVAGLTTVRTWWDHHEHLYGFTSFHVNAAPEPGSVALYLTGGLIMAISFLRRRRKLATV